MSDPRPNDHRITLEEARAYVKRGRAGRGNSRAPWAWHFRREAFDALLTTPGAGGIRIYAARTEAGEETLVMVATDADGQDLTTSEIMEKGTPCPPLCGDPSLFEG